MIQDNFYEGRRGFVVGGGPSISEYDKNLLTKLDSEIVIGTNKSYKIINPTYTVIGDSWYYDTFTEEIELLKHEVIFPSTIKLRQILNHYVILNRKDQPDKEVPTSFKNPISFKNNAGCTALRVAYLLGCNPIYLVGIDCRLELEPDRVRTHWHEYYPQNRRPSKDRLKVFYNLWTDLIGKMSESRKIYSCSPTSELNKFVEWIDLKNVLSSKT